MSYGKRFKEWNLDCKVYVGNLNEMTSKSEVETAFGRFGSLKNVWLARNPPGFAFVEYEDNRDAEDAVRTLDGTRIGDSRVRVEMSHGRTRRGGFHTSIRRGGGGGGDRHGGERFREPRDAARYEKSYRKSRSRTRSRSLSRSFSRSRSRDRGSVPRRGHRYGRSVSRSRSRRRSPSVDRQPYLSPPPRSPRAVSPRRVMRSPRGRSRSPIKDRR